MTTLRRYVATILVCVLLPATATAQKRINDWNNVVALDAGQQVVVRLKSGGVLTGYVAGATVDSVTIDIEIRSPVATTGTTGFARRIDRSDVQEVRKAKGSRVVSALVGGAIGIGIGAGIGAAVEARSPSQEDRGLLIGTLGTLGGLMGGAIGANRPFKGKKIYVAP